MPMQRERYPANWEAVSREIRERADQKCERCGVPNGALIQREPGSDRYHELTPMEAETTALEGGRVTRVVLTTAHLGTVKPDGSPGDKHDKLDVRPENLAALCQRCHLLEDLDDHVRHAAETRRRRKIKAGQ